MGKSATSFKKGEKKPTRKGCPNKITKTVRENFLDTFIKFQKHPTLNLYSWGKDNITEFYKLSSKLIPTELAGLDKIPPQSQIPPIIIQMSSD